MAPMTILCTSLGQGGGEWVFGVARLAMSLSSPLAYHEASRLDGAPLAELLATRARHHRVVSTALDDEPAGTLDLLRRSMAEGIVHRCVVASRHPMDALEAFVRGGGGAQAGITEVLSALTVAESLRELPEVLFVDVWEHGPDAALGRILEYLGVQLTADQRNEVMIQCSPLLPSRLDWTTDLSVATIAAACVAFAEHSVSA